MYYINKGGDQVMKIMIDPGHGGHDPGATGFGLQEKDINLTISKHIRNILLNEYINLEVQMTRDTDVFVDLLERANMANSWGADYFLSIHTNAGGGTGFESYIHTTRSNGSVQAQDTVHPLIIDTLGVRDRGKKDANFAVLRETFMPALLTENLFIDHPDDSTLLKDSAFLKLIARGHVSGLEHAFKLEKKSSEIYRVIVDGTQVGAYGKHENILAEVKSHLGTSTEILVQKV
jgi:N-acetylmuramoyl-L-alanine amidase